MTTRHAAKAADSLRMRNPVGDDTPEDVIIIADDEPPVAMVEEDPGHAFRINPDKPLSSSRLPSLWWVLFTLAWFTHGVIVPEQLRIPFSTQVVGLDYLSDDIAMMEYGKELLRAFTVL
ncbi:hypothetical protein AMTR_s00001p00272420 [Amborella trichopoda]|uniref:Uncharacterized protein n=1 Tax=Amborella trichopoda TaxID=13333 RepID=W1NMW4_AMBTC|nr:hypothetical protein AMTR_s00001p00272420 [Amborella trichopoda]